jgi:hypothetical protein
MIVAVMASVETSGEATSAAVATLGSSIVELGLLPQTAAVMGLFPFPCPLITQ